MKLKKLILFICLTLLIPKIHSQIIENKEGEGFIKDYKLLKSIKGEWKLVHLIVDNMEVDCENFEESLSKELNNNKDNHAEIKEKFNYTCNDNNYKIIKISNNSIFDKNLNKMTLFKLDNNLKDNTIMVNEGENKFELKIIKLSNNYFKIYYTDKMWLKFKKIND